MLPTTEKGHAIFRSLPVLPPLEFVLWAGDGGAAAAGGASSQAGLKTHMARRTEIYKEQVATNCCKEARCHMRNHTNGQKGVQVRVVVGGELGVDSPTFSMYPNPIVHTLNVQSTVRTFYLRNAGLGTVIA